MIAELIAESGDIPKRDIDGLLEAFYKTYRIPSEYRVYIFFLSDEGIQEYNQEFFSKDSSTDVISVNIEDDFDGEYVWGEIYVSSETAHRVAENSDLKWEDEAVLYITHGLFHLMGKEDDTDLQREALWKEQLSFLEQCGYAPVAFVEGD